MQFSEPSSAVRTGTSRLRAIVLAAIIVGAVFYLFQYRYYARIVLLPTALFEVVDSLNPGWLYPRLSFKGSLESPSFDLSTEAGVAEALTFVRAYSPSGGDGGRVSYAAADFDTWLAQLPTSAAYCTDFTALFQLVAQNNGYRAREWWIWNSRGYFGGQAHSVSEFFNPRTERWQVVDPMHATIVRDGGSPASMSDVIRAYQDGRRDGIVFDRLPIMDRLGFSNPKISSGPYFEPLLNAPVLNLKPGSWMASTPKSDLAVGFAILTWNGGHGIHVYTTKVVAVILLVAVYLVWREARVRRSLSAGGRDP